MKKIIAVAACTIVICSSSVASAAIIDVVTNGSFDSGLTGWVIDNPYNNNVGIASVDIDGAGSLGMDDAFFAQTAGGFSSSPVDIWQSVSLIAGTEYTLFANIASYALGSSNDSGGEITVSIGGTVINNYDFDYISSSSWEYAELSATFVASSSGIFNFNIFRPYYANDTTPINYLDNISMTYDDGNTPPAAVPEPATMLLFGTGLIGLIGYNRKRMNQKK